VIWLTILYRNSIKGDSDIYIMCVHGQAPRISPTSFVYEPNLVVGVNRDYFVNHLEPSTSRDIHATRVLGRIRFILLVFARNP
jgi:hypothetical protein